MSRNVTVSEWAGNIEGLTSLTNNIITIARVVPGSGVGGWKCLLDKFNAIECVRLEGDRRGGGVRLALLDQACHLRGGEPDVAVTLRARHLNALAILIVIVHSRHIERCNEIHMVLVFTVLPATIEDHRADVDVQLAKLSALPTHSETFNDKSPLVMRGGFVYT